MHHHDCIRTLGAAEHTIERRLEARAVVWLMDTWVKVACVMAAILTSSRSRYRRYESREMGREVKFGRCDSVTVCASPMRFVGTQVHMRDYLLEALEAPIW